MLITYADVRKFKFSALTLAIALLAFLRAITLAGEDTFFFLSFITCVVMGFTGGVSNPGWKKSLAMLRCCLIRIPLSLIPEAEEGQAVAEAWIGYVLLEAAVEAAVFGNYADFQRKWRLLIVDLELFRGNTMYGNREAYLASVKALTSDSFAMIR